MANSKLAALSDRTPDPTDYQYLSNAAGTVDGRATVQTLRDFVSHDAARLGIYGHSLAYGGGVTDPDRDLTTHLASMLKMRELPRAVSGAILHSSQITGIGDGGWAHVLQNDIRPTRVSTNLTAAATGGTTTQLTVTSTTGMLAGTLLHVGTGDTSGSGGEILWVLSVADATHVNIQRTDGLTTTCARSHASGEPVYVVPSAYIQQVPLYLNWYGTNDIPYSPITSATTVLKEMYMSPLRTVLARHRCAEIYENDHKSITYSGSGWTLLNNATAFCSGSSINQATTVTTSVATIHVPDNFPGGAVAAGWVIGSNPSGTPTTSTITFTVDGSAAGTLTMPANISTRINTAVKRFTGLAAGRHQIVCTLTALGSGAGVYFDWWGIEAPEPPLVVVMGANRPLTWNSYPAGASWPNGRRTTTLTGAHNQPLTSFTVGSTTGVLVGSTVTFEEGTANAETREVATVPTGTTFTTTTATAINHAGGTSVVFGAQDADVTKLNTNIQSVISEFDSRVQYFDVDTLINKNSAYFYSDGLHINDAGHAVMTLNVFRLVQKYLSSTLASYTSSPAAPLPSAVNFSNNPGSAAGANTQWTNMPAALTELFGVAAHRKFVDLRRSYEARFVVGVQVAGSTNARLRIQYSLDSGTTWKYLFRTPTYTEDTSHEANLSATGMKDSGWKPIAAEALADNVWMRVVGINGDATADPTFGTIDLYVR